MTYEEAKLHIKELEKVNDYYSNKLNSFEKGEMGLTPKHVKESPEWQEAKTGFDKTFAELRNFNAYFIKTFKKEYNKERAEKRKMLQR